MRDSSTEMIWDVWICSANSEHAIASLLSAYLWSVRADGWFPNGFTDYVQRFAQPHHVGRLAHNGTEKDGSDQSNSDGFLSSSDEEEDLEG